MHECMESLFDESDRNGYAENGQNIVMIFKTVY